MTHATRQQRAGVLEYIHPPIPIRQFDWWAARDGYEPGDLYGTGSTQEEAIEALLIAEWERSWRLPAGIPAVVRVEEFTP